eukprot:CAMPEP_0172623508 /NCGR_PEP_ID=MMETSP1068-20121228/129335_1 /TAXON_ID=35684 /ORGANISM="Pseudopedinella elastica, Strain CCMP716" /LENGTH=53 /DNA_ID=CAMNT_0013432101 /DNA_START=1020 /DNA_END=1181 /DNA_ORIENTATION=-
MLRDENDVVLSCAASVKAGSDGAHEVTKRLQFDKFARRGTLGRRGFKPNLKLR